MRIVVTNDDGIYSPGLLTLARAAQGFGEVRIVAPDVEMSSAGHSITSSRPLTYKPTSIPGFEAYRVNGTPADCVALGTYNWEKVDLILSGINLGSNLGNAVWHSGTVAGALFPAVQDVLGMLVTALDLKLVNVNFPPYPAKGIRWTCQSVRHYDGEVVDGNDPMGRSHFWFVVKPIEGTDPDSDRWAVEHGYTSITPLRIDLTDEPLLSARTQAKQSGERPG
jgi:5'-nucleotidase